MLKYFKGSPLWLIGLFVLFAEATSAIAAVKLDGWPQQALVIFVIAYATVVTAIFFLFLWFKPENFYAPSDYGDVSPESYVNALRGLPSETINAVVNLEDNPFDQDALFALMDALVPEETKQHLILVSKLGGILDVSNADERGNTHTHMRSSHETKVFPLVYFRPGNFSATLMEHNSSPHMTTIQRSNLRHAEKNLLHGC